MNYLLVFLGGGLGSICRYGLNEALARYQFAFPWATFIANVLSCIVFGFVASLFLKGSIGVPHRLFILTGFCGGFSTFSTFTHETFLLLNNQQLALAFVNIFISLIACLLGLYIGIKMSALLNF